MSPAKQVVRKDLPIWGDPNITEQILIQEDTLSYPSTTGGTATRTLQRAGLMRRLRMLLEVAYNVSAFTSAPSKSEYGVLGAALRRIIVKANGSFPLVDLSGLGAAIWNEIQNPDGSVLTAADYTSTLGMVAAAELAQYDAIAGTGDFVAKYPFEFLFGLPVNVRGFMQEFGLWLLQNQAIDVGVEVNFNAPSSVAANKNALWSGNVHTGALTVAGSLLRFERELYKLPQEPTAFPDLGWGHQVIEYDTSFNGSLNRFNIPRSGILLRAVLINLDANGALIEYTDVDSVRWMYGSNDTPVDRPGWAPVHEFVHDYHRLPPKGVITLDFYKWGRNGWMLAKDTEGIANLRIETRFKTTTSGTQRVILETLMPVMSAGK